jgi:hypothetical protein
MGYEGADCTLRKGCNTWNVEVEHGRLRGELVDLHLVKNTLHCHSLACMLVATKLQRPLSLSLRAWNCVTAVSLFACPSVSMLMGLAPNIFSLVTELSLRIPNSGSSTERNAPPRGCRDFKKRPRVDFFGKERWAEPTSQRNQAHFYFRK